MCTLRAVSSLFSLSALLLLLLLPLSSLGVKEISAQEAVARATTLPHRSTAASPVPQIKVWPACKLTLSLRQQLRVCAGRRTSSVTARARPRCHCCYKPAVLHRILVILVKTHLSAHFT